MNTRFLIIGYGNPLRGDDGAGPAVVEQLAALRVPVQTLTCHLLTPELAQTVAGYECVVFVDAEVNGPPEVRVRPVQAATSPRLSGHACTPAELISLAQEVYGSCNVAWSVTIPTRQFEFGYTFSPETQSGIAEAVERIQRIVAEGAKSPTQS